MRSHDAPMNFIRRAAADPAMNSKTGCKPNERSTGTAKWSKVSDGIVT